MRTTKFNMKDFGLRLRKLRQACGLTQEEFCDVIGISDTHYRKIEAGTRTGSLELIVEISLLFLGPDHIHDLPVFRQAGGAVGVAF